MKSYNSAFELLTEDPVELELLKRKSELMNSIVDNIKSKELTQGEAALIIDCDQPRISRLMNGRISEFSLGWLFQANERIKVCF